MNSKISLSVVNFLELILQAIQESDASPEIIYPILDKNLDKLTNDFHLKLKKWTEEKLANLKPEESLIMAKSIGNLCILIRQYPFPFQANNLEIAIAGYEVISTVFTREHSPENWAINQQNLGDAYCLRILGNKAHNLERGISCFKKALQVYTRKDSPFDWAGIQNNLGNAYCDRIIGRKEENLEESIKFHKKALNICTSDNFPEEFAYTQNCLGNAYSKRLLGKKSKNLERAIQHYKKALEAYDIATYPEQWAATQDNLGDTYQERILGKKAENLERAIAHHKNALLIHTRKLYPEKWAMTNNSLGAAYSRRIFGKRAENLKREIKYYKKALLVFVIESFPLDRAMTLYNLGLAYKNSLQFDLAYNTFADAITTVEFLRSQTIFEDYTALTDTVNDLESNPAKLLSEEEVSQEVKQKFAEQWNLLYQVMVEVCLKLGYIEQAIEYVERSKTRNLIEFITENESSSNFEFIHFAQILEILPDKSTSIIEWYITPETFVVFIISNQMQQPIVWEPPLTERKEVLQALFNWGNRYLDDYEYDGEGGKKWKDELNETLRHLASILRFDEILSLIPENCNQLILIPHWFLHLLPLHALPLIPGENQCLLDIFSRGVRYAPSCHLLYMTKNRARHQAEPNSLLPHLFAVQNPTEDLFYADLEVEVICRYFQNAKVLAQSKATKTAFHQELSSHNSTLGNYIHFSCHAFFNPDFSFKTSALFFANSYVTDDFEKLSSQLYLILEENNNNNTKFSLDKCLTLREIWNLKLNQCYLVTLSACETGITNFKNVSDEYISIGGSFLYAGTPNVVNSLWPVSDLSTAFLMVKFYQNLQIVNSVTVALNQAQLWLRNITKKELEIWVAESQIPLDATLDKDLRRRLRKMSHSDRPFESPFYWAAFCAIGQ